MCVPIVAVLFVLSLLILHSRRKAYRHQFPLPPGPKKLPIVENLFDVPNSDCIWLEYAKLCQRYKSDIIHLSALGNSIIALNSVKAINDLLDKRSSIYSSRPPTIMLGELMGWRSVSVFRPNDNLWKAQRKIFSQAIPATDSKRFHPKLMSVTHDLLRALLRSDDLTRTLHIWAAVFIMDITYGFKSEEAKAYLPITRAAAESIDMAGAFGAFYVDQIPFLKYVPEWFPGAGFKRKAREWSGLRVEMTQTPFEVTKHRLAMGVATPSLTSVALSQMDSSQDLIKQEEAIKTAAVTAYIGGSDTALTGLKTFIFAMLMNPEIQAKAHRQLEQVLGLGTLPSFEDEVSLPYITSIVQETLRHQTVAPLGFPHELTEDDIYEGYLIPKGSIILANIWSILHDPEDYPEPDIFNPSRFLDADGKINPTVKDPSTYAFGFGRRVCPGKSLALASLWIAIASILSCYSIEPELDEQGKLIQPEMESHSGPTLLNHPPAFKCRFVPLSRDVECLLGLD